MHMYHHNISGHSNGFIKRPEQRALTWLAGPLQLRITGFCYSTYKATP